MTPAPRILVFDSGLGGLTVFREVRALRPDAHYVYVADDVYFPYSDHEEDVLRARILDVIAGLLAEHNPDLVVVACNTASTLVLSALRERFQVPFVGTVPAIKPACTLSQTRLVSVLGTEATVTREYTQGLIRDFAQDCSLTLVGSDRLAAIAEASLNGESVDGRLLSSQVAECFQEQAGKRTDVVVLACTHFPLLLEHLVEVAPWPVQWIDPAEAIARRVESLLGGPPEATRGTTRFCYVSGRAPSKALQAALVRFGMDAGAG